MKYKSSLIDLKVVKNGKDAAIISDAEPADKEYLWCDTSTSPPTLKQWDGNEWIIVNDSAEQIMQAYSDIVTMISDAEGQIKLDIRKDVYTKEEVKDLLSTQEASFTGTYKGFVMDFAEFKKQVGADQSTTNTKFEEWQKYIRFEDGSIILGVVGNPMTAILKNNRLSFLQNNYEVAYISNNALYISHAVVTDDLTVGQVMQKQLPSGYYVFTRA